MTVRRAGAVARLALLALGLSTAACGSTTVTPQPTIPIGTALPSLSIPYYSPSPPGSPEAPAVVYARIERQVQDMRGLDATKPVTPHVLDRSQLEKNFRERFDKDYPPAYVDATERLYKAMGLMPNNASLKALYLKLLTSQVIGYYDSDAKELFVVSRSGGLGPLEQFTFAHEYTHALQDQHFGLDKLRPNVLDQGDLSTARLSVAEGDATLLMSDWAAANLSLVQLLQITQAGLDPAQTEVLNSMPQLLRDQLQFPYTQGLAFVTGLRTAGGWPAVDAAYADPPDSTEQILHSAKYLAHEPPIKITIPSDLAGRLGSGWRVDLEDTLGEFTLDEWLAIAGGADPATAVAAAEGWGGDRIVLVSKGSTYGIALQTAWDSPSDAAEFAAAARAALKAMADSTAMVDPGAGSNRSTVTLFIASDDATISRLAGALGIAQ